MRAAEIRICILDQSAVHGSGAECTRIRCSAQKTEYTIGIRRPSRSNVARDHIFSGLRGAKNENFNFCAQTGKYVVAGYV